ncbi:MAG: hypothetical protein ACX93T_04305, partial [Bacteroidota bacterium]
MKKTFYIIFRNTFSNRQNYILGILTAVATTLLSCNKPHTTAMAEEEQSIVRQGQSQHVHNYHENILPTVSSSDSSEQVFNNVTLPESIVRRRTSLHNTISVIRNAEAADIILDINEQELHEMAAIKIQAIARMYLSKKQLMTEGKAVTRKAWYESWPSLSRAQQLTWIKLNALGASAFALGGYAKYSFFQKKRAKEEQAAREQANSKIRQLEAANSEYKLRTAVDLYTQHEPVENSPQTAVDSYTQHEPVENSPQTAVGFYTQYEPVENSPQTAVGFYTQYEPVENSPQAAVDSYMQHEPVENSPKAAVGFYTQYEPVENSPQAAVDSYTQHEPVEN